MNLEQFRAEADPMMRLVNNQFAEIFGGDIVGKIQGATEDMRSDEDARHRNELYASDNFIQTANAGECLRIIKNLIERVSELYASDNFIQTANAGECLRIIKNLIERVSELTGIAPELEDAARSLEKHIAWENSRG